MHKKRPVNLDLVSIRFPITAIVSILHRMSGVFLFFAIPFGLYLLNASLSSALDFNDLTANLNNFWIRFIVFAVMIGFIYHFFAGIRHLIMDFGYGETKKGGKVGSYLLLFVSIIFMIVAGVWLWLV